MLSTKDLVGRLIALVDDPDIFVFGENSDEWRRQMIEAIPHIVDNAAWSWSLLHDGASWFPFIGWDALFERFEVLTSGRGECLFRAVRKIEEAPDIDEEDRRFLWFVLGGFEATRAAYVRRNS